jgi:hypothetical protein
MKYIDKHEGTALKKTKETPEDLLKIIPTNPRMPPPRYSSRWVPPSYLRPKFIEDERDYSNVPNINILVSFTFRHEAELYMVVYGPPKPRETTTTTTTTTPKSTTAS